MSYRDYFPAEAGWGRVPVWGFAEVEASEADGVEPGTRLFGYLPPSSHLLVQPAAIEEAGFVDGSGHRAGLPSAYQRYLATGADPFYRADTEEMQMLLRPLFFTSFLLDDQLADEGMVDAGPVLISSASSKTAIAAAFLLSRREAARPVGLTSPARRGFVEGLGIYESVVAYDEIDSMEAGPGAFVDVSGDPAVRAAVHGRFGDALAKSLAVGATHWQQLTAGSAEADGGGLVPGSGELPGPQPEFFFAPARVSKRSADWGRDGLGSRVAEAWHPFCEWTAVWLSTIRGRGFDGLRDAYVEVLDGRVAPDTAHVISL
jgi:hypothetical protein